jgi:hypothetical protein
MAYKSFAVEYERIFKRSAQIGDNLTNNRKKNVMKSVLNSIISKSTPLPDCIADLISTFWSQYPDSPICKGNCDKKFSDVRLNHYINNISSVDSTGFCRPCRKLSESYYYLKCHFCGNKAFSCRHGSCFDCGKTRDDWLTLQWNRAEEARERAARERAVCEQAEREARGVIRHADILYFLPKNIK